MENKKISALGYGFAILSPIVFEKLRKEYKIRSKKMLSFFDANNSSFYDFISKGAFLPLARIPYDRYELFFDFSGEADIPKDWKMKNSWKGFNLTIEEDSLWALNFEELENWKYDDLVEKKSIEGVYYDFDDNEYIDYKGIGYELPTGKYIVEICGLEKKNFVKDELENYGFLFRFKSVQTFIKSSDSSETDFSTMFSG